MSKANPIRVTFCNRCKQDKPHYTQMTKRHKKRQTNRPCIDCRSDSSRGNQSRAPEYVSWKGMLARCKNPSHKAYKDYGGRGIDVCKGWESFEAFIESMGKKPSASHSIDRVDNNKGYSPGNCRWATKEEQARNRRDTLFLTVDGTTLPLCDWVGRSGISRSVLVKRKKAGWSDRDAVTVPLSEKNSRRPVTPAILKEMRQLRKKGMPLRKIAQRLSVSQTTVFYHTKEAS